MRYNSSSKIKIELCVVKVVCKKKKKKYNLYLPSAVFIAGVLVGPSKQLKKNNSN